MSASNHNLSKKCTKCRRHLHLNAFHAKPKGKHGKDARCRKCISAIKRSQKAKIKQRNKKVELIQTQVVGHLNIEQQIEFAKIFSSSVSALLEKGKLRD